MPCSTNTPTPSATSFKSYSSATFGDAAASTSSNTPTPSATSFKSFSSASFGDAASSSNHLQCGLALAAVATVGYTAIADTEAAPQPPTTIQQGSRVGIKYVGKDATTGDVFTATKNDEQGNPVLATFTLGSGNTFVGLEKAVQGRTVGDSFTVLMAPEEAYGEHKPALVKRLPRDRLPQDLKIGEHLEMTTKTNTTIRVRVVDIQEDEVVVDGNHPLAGKTISFDVEICTLSPPLGKVVPINIEKEGDGKHFPQQNDQVTVHYVGTLASNGQGFDSSRARGEPFTFTIGIGQVIKGWDEGVSNMSLGQRATLHIPSEKGYGKRGAGNSIPPHSDLKFDVELLRIYRPSTKLDVKAKGF
jgi:FK506-binding protein 1